jgi:hypothetical protein
MSSHQRNIRIIIMIGILLIGIIPNPTIMKNISTIQVNDADQNANIDESIDLPRMSESSVADLVYSTFFGGDSGEAITGSGMDDAGNIYAVGFTNSRNFPVTVGANDTLFNEAGSDVFIAKFLPNGSLGYCTFLGGSGADQVVDMCVYPNGSVIVIGYTTSIDFLITTNAYDKIKEGLYDSFISILNPTGSVFTYSSYLGGNQSDEAQDVVIDPLGNIYIVGQTTSTDFPTTLGAYDRIYNGSGGLYDGFITKFAPNGASLIYSTYIGGTSTDCVNGIAVDAFGCAIITGVTGSSNFPCTPNATDSIFGVCEGFLVKFNPLGTGLYYSSFIGDSQADWGYKIGLDSYGNIFISGYTSSPNFPVTNGAYDITYNGGSYDIFVVKFAPDCRSLQYSTFIGGSDLDFFPAMDVDKEGYVFITGVTFSSNFPITIGAFNSSYGGNEEIFVAKVDQSGDRLLYSTYIGGSYADAGLTLMSDNDGCVILMGRTASPNFPCTINAFNYTKWVGQDAFITKIRIDPQISHPNDLLYEYGQTSNRIVWTANDSMVGTTSYQICQSGSPVASGGWVSEIPIIFNVDGLDKGIYIYEITLNNGLGGFVKDIVSVTVERNILTEIKAFMTQNALVLILFGINLLGIIVIVSIMQRKFKRLTKLIEKPSTTQTNPIIKQSIDQKTPLPRQPTVQKIPVDDKNKKPVEKKK